MFDDDLKIYKLISRINPCNDCFDLQMDLDRLDVWCGDNHLPINLNKSSVISFFKGFTLNYLYSIGRDDLNRVTSVCDLWMLKISDRFFNNHISDVVTRALTSLDFVMRRALVFHKMNTLRSHYFILVKSIFEYNLILCFSFHTYNIILLDRIQNRFLRLAVRQFNVQFDRHTHDYNNFRIIFNITLVTSRFLFCYMLFFIMFWMILFNVHIYCH